MGFLVSGGLLYIKIFQSREWKRFRNYKPEMHWLYTICYFLACGVLLGSAFARPQDGSPFAPGLSSYPWYLIPTIGLSSPFWGMAWWIGLHAVMRRSKKKLVVMRRPLVVPDDDDEGQWVQMAEMIDHEWRGTLPQTWLTHDVQISNVDADRFGG